MIFISCEDILMLVDRVWVVGRVAWFIFYSLDVECV